jgi:hypothetical protein
MVTWWELQVEIDVQVLTVNTWKVIIQIAWRREG